MQVQPFDVTRMPRLASSWRAIRRCGELGVPAASAAALGDQDAVSLDRQVRNLDEAFVGPLVDYGPDRYLERQVRAVAPGPVRSLSVPAARRFVLRMESIIDEGIEVRARHHVHRAAMSPVPPARSAARDELFAAERHAAVAPATGRYGDVDFVDEHQDDAAAAAIRGLAVRRMKEDAVTPSSRSDGALRARLSDLDREPERRRVVKGTRGNAKLRAMRC